MKTTTTANFELRGSKYEAQILIEVLPDDIAPEDHFDNAQDIADARAGKFDVMFIHVTARAFGIKGFDSIGAVCIARPEDVQTAIADYSMIENALTELAKNIVLQARNLSQFA